MKRGAQVRRTTILLGVMIAFLAGLAVARIRINIPPAWLVPLALLCALMLRRKNWQTLIVMCLLGFGLGMWRGSYYMQKLRPYSELHNHKVVVMGRASSDGVYGDRSQLEFELSELTLLEPVEQPLVGKIMVRGFGEPSIHRGDLVQVYGKLYQTRGSKQASISFADILLVKTGGGLIERARLRFVAGVQSALPEPQASFGLGLLVGQRSTLPEHINEQLSIVGLTHIVAVSGYNLTILVLLAQRLLAKRSKYQTFMASALLIIMFLLLTGLSASIVRAAIVSGLSLLSWYYGRKVKPLLLIALAAAVTAGWYPPYLWSDVGWYLSFLAFFGVLVIAPLLMKRMKMHNVSAHPLKALVVETIAAIAMTAPLIMYIFGQLSVIAVIANILVVPFVPIAMLLTLLAGIAGMMLPALAGWFSWPATLVLTYMLDVVAVLHRIPGAVIPLTIDIVRIIGIYAVIVCICVLLWHKTRAQGIITETELVES